MWIDKNYKGLKQIENGDYVLEGDLISDDEIEIDLDDRLIVRGDVISKKYIKANRTLIAENSIKAGWGIKAGDGIEAGDGIKSGSGIEAGLGIKAGRGIEAGSGIKAGTFIDSGRRIFAGISVYRTSDDCEKFIRCSELRNGEICYGDLIITEKKEEVENGTEKENHGNR